MKTYTETLDTRMAKDAEFIIHARQGIPVLIDEVECLGNVVERLRKERYTGYSVGDLMAMNGVG